MNGMKSHKSNSLMWVVWTVVILVIIFCVLWFSWLKPHASVTPVFAPPGQVTAGFPKQYLIDSGASITQSYAINYSSSTNQYTVQWNSSSSALALAAGYDIYFQNAGWNIINESTSSQNFQSIYAVNASGSLNFVANQQGMDTAVVLTYLPVGN
jgi:hypothetical protein